MPLETGTYISDLVATNPLGTDDASLGDDHIRLIKLVLKNTFPSITGPVTLTQDTLNSVLYSGTWTGVIPITQVVYDTDLQELGYLASDGIWRHAQPAGSYQAAGDYATNTALQAEATRATGVENDLQTDVNNRVLKTGDTMTGLLASSGSGGGFVSLMAPSSPSTGDYVNYTGFASVADGRGGELHFQLQEHVGTNFSALISLKGNDGTVRYFSIPQGSPMHDSDYGDVAYANDLAAYQPKGDYVPTSEISYGTLNNGYYTQIGNILTQTFEVTLTPDGNGNATITFPQAYSSPPKVIGLGSVETAQAHSAVLINQTNGSGVLTSATQAFLHFSTGAGTSSTAQSVVTITAQGVA